jgi:hypothetical protein
MCVCVHVCVRACVHVAYCECDFVDNTYMLSAGSVNN